MSAPESVDLTAAARAVIEESGYTGQGTAFEGALAVWTALTGSDPVESLADTEAILANLGELAAANPPVVAQIAPF